MYIAPRRRLEVDLVGIGPKLLLEPLYGFRVPFFTPIASDNRGYVVIAVASVITPVLVGAGSGVVRDAGPEPVSGAFAAARSINKPSTGATRVSSSRSAASGTVLSDLGTFGADTARHGM